MYYVYIYIYNRYKQFTCIIVVYVVYTLLLYMTCYVYIYIYTYQPLLTHHGEAEAWHGASPSLRQGLVLTVGEALQMRGQPR